MPCVQASLHATDMEGMGNGKIRYPSRSEPPHEKMQMFSVHTGIAVDPSIYIEDKVMTELTSGKFVPGDMVPRFKDLERGNSMLISAPRSRVTISEKQVPRCT